MILQAHRALYSFS